MKQCQSWWKEALVTNPSGKNQLEVMARVAKLTQEGLDISTYLYQVPADEGQRKRLREILDEILKAAVLTHRRELPRLAAELRAVIDQPPSLDAAALLQEGFDRMQKLWDAAKSGWV